MAPDSDRAPEYGAEPEVDPASSGEASASGRNRSGRRRLWMLTAVVAVLAMVGATIVVLSTSGDDELTVLRVGSQQRAMGEMGVADMMWAPTRFELADGVDIAAGDGPAWQWTTPSDADVANLAERLGLSGTPQPVSTDMGGGWQLDDLTVSASGEWYFGNPTVSVCVDAPPGATTSPPVRAGDAGSGPAVDEVVDDAVDDVAACEPVNPVPVPSADEALATAERIVGEEVDASFEAVSADPAWVVVEITYLVDGQPSGQVGNIAFGRDGLSGFGRLGTAKFAGNYPTISAVDALERLNQPMGLGAMANATILFWGVAAGEVSDVTVYSGPDAAVSSDEFVDPVPPVDAPDVDPAVDGPFEEPQERVVVFVDVRAATVPFYDADGSVWSLPGYEYSDVDGLAWAVIAVADEYLEIDGDQPGDWPGSGDEPGSSPGSPGDGSGDVIEPGFPDGQQPATPDVVGRTEAEATAVAKQSGFVVRVVARDGEYFMVTQDFSSDRVNLVIEAGVVTDAYVG